MFNKKIKEELKNNTKRLAKIEAMLSSFIVKTVPNIENEKTIPEKVNSLSSEWIVIPSAIKKQFSLPDRFGDIFYVIESYVAEKQNINEDVYKLTLVVTPIGVYSPKAVDDNLNIIKCDVVYPISIDNWSYEDSISPMIDVLVQNKISDKAVILSQLKANGGRTRGLSNL